MRISSTTIIIIGIFAIVFIPVFVMLAMISTGGAGYATVIGRYTCASPVTGAPDYCELMSDGTYLPVPWNVYSTAPYGSTLSFSNSRWSVHGTGRISPDVDYSQWRTAKRVTTISSYTGMSSKRGAVTVYKSSGLSVKSSYRGH